MMEVIMIIAQITGSCVFNMLEYTILISVLFCTHSNHTSSFPCVCVCVVCVCLCVYVCVCVGLCVCFYVFQE